MKKSISFKWLITILIAISFSIGLIIGLYNNQCSKKLKAYKEYEKAVEAVLDECYRTYDIVDTVYEGDAYQDYLDAKNNL